MAGKSEKRVRVMRLLGAAGLLLAAAFFGLGEGAFAAALGKPEPWQINMQLPASPSAEGIHQLHTLLTVLITLITIFVLGLLVVVMVRFNAKAHPVPSRTTHNTTIEVLWTIIPVVILLAIAVPSFRLLYLQRDMPDGDMTVKVTGNKWYWSYEYPDHAGVAFDSNILSDADADASGQPRHLAADNPMVVPVGKTVRLIVTASDVIHAWTVPSFGSKIDAVPGRLNEEWFNVDQPGIYYGQCSELCGKDHAFMPVMVRAVPEPEFNAWVETAKTAGVEAANRMLAALPAPERQSMAAAAAE